MADEQTEVIVDGQTTEQSTTIPELELGPEGTIEAEEGTPKLPSDEADFVIPEKFQGKSAEEIAKAYVELEKFKGTTVDKTETPAEKPEDAPQGNKYLEEYLESGELSEESYAELEEKGVSREEAKDRLEFEQYKRQKAIDNLTSVIGGAEEFKAMDEWAKEAFTQEELQTYSTEMQKATEYGKKAILRDLYGQYKEANKIEEPSGGDVVHTNEPQTIGGKGYTDQYQLQEDMSDPRYGVDRSYTQAVEAKVARSKNL